MAISLTMAPMLVVAIAATAVAGAAVIATNIPHAYPGIENPGQPLAGARMECMTPPQAGAFLAAHGYTGVVWQVEGGDASSRDAKTGTSVSQSAPPEHGYVVPGAVLEDGRLHMVVDQRPGAQGVGDCFGQPMP